MKLFSRSGLLSLLFAALFTISGCKNKPLENSGVDHPGYLDSTFKKFLTNLTDSAKYHRLVDSAYGTLKNPGPGDRWDRYFYFFGFAEFISHNFTRAQQYADSMQDVLQPYASEDAYLERYAKSLFAKGDALVSEKHYAEAFTVYYKAHEVILRKNDPCTLSEYSSRLAAATFRQGHFLDATEYYKQAVRDLEGCDNQTSARFGEIQGSLDNIGIAYVKAGVYDSADVYFNRALAYIDSNARYYPDRANGFIEVAKAVIYGNQAGVAIQQKRFDVAEKLLTESIRITRLPDHPDEDAGYSLIKLIKIYIEQNRYPEAETKLRELDSLVQKYHTNTDLRKDFYLLSAKLNEFRKDHTNAYKFLLRYQHISDSLDRINIPVAAADMQQTMENMNREYLFQGLAKDNKRKSDLLWLTIIIATMAIAIVVLIWVNYKRYKNNVHTLVQLNETVSNKNQALLQTLAALEQSHNNNTRLLKVVAHDLRGPLGAITSIAELAGDGMLPGEKYQEVMAIIFRSGTKALTLANHLLSDMQTIGELTDPEPLNIAEQLSSCVELYAHKIQEKEQTVSLKTVPAFVNGEREKLWRVFSNLISNAVKFSRVGGKIEISMHTDESNVIITVHDNGIGIPDDLKDRIFEPTEATTRAGTIGERSFGLGLSISKNIVTQHSGTLWFESDYQEGTSFYVSLPLLKTDHAS